MQGSRQSPARTRFGQYLTRRANQRHSFIIAQSVRHPWPRTLHLCHPQLARARRVPTVRALRKKLNLTQEEFAARFHLPLGTVRDWEQGAHRPDKAAQVLLTVIAKEPDAVARALES